MLARYAAAVFEALEAALECEATDAKLLPPLLGVLCQAGSGEGFSLLLFWFISSSLCASCPYIFSFEVERPLSDTVPSGQQILRASRTQPADLLFDLAIPFVLLSGVSGTFCCRIGHCLRCLLLSWCTRLPEGPPPRALQASWQLSRVLRASRTCFGAA